MQTALNPQIWTLLSEIDPQAFQLISFNETSNQDETFAKPFFR